MICYYCEEKKEVFSNMHGKTICGQCNERDIRLISKPNQITEEQYALRLKIALNLRGKLH